MYSRWISIRNRQCSFAVVALLVFAAAITWHVTSQIYLYHKHTWIRQQMSRKRGFNYFKSDRIASPKHRLNYSLLTNDKGIVKLLETVETVGHRKNVSLSDIFAGFRRELTLKYPPFTIDEPHFLNTRDKEIFLKNPRNRENLASPPREKLRGVIRMFHNGSAHASYDCGWNSDLRQYGNGVVGAEDGLAVMCPILVPGGSSFQHFVDGVLPKVVQVLPFLRHREVKLVLHAPRDAIIWEILLQMNITQDQVVVYHSGTAASSHVLDTCITPPLHPLLWRTARALLVPDRDHVTAGHVVDADVVLLTRARHHNPGRNIVNFAAVVAFLRRRYARRLRVFRGGLTLRESSALFGKARLVIGVHGGAFYNVLFCRDDATVVEVRISVIPDWSLDYCCVLSD